MDRSILHNGLTNALKFCKDGPIVLSLTTSENGGVVITITDAGIGFDQARLPHLFKPFTKQNEHSPGAGLGLFITKALAKRMGGTLELASAPGVGTTFKAVVLAQFTAPSARPLGPLIRRVVTEDQSSLPPSPAPSPPPAAALPDLVHALATPGAESPPPPPLRVLVVDDNDLCRKLLLMGLRRSPYQPLMLSEAADGAAAVAAFAAAQPDLVLTDVSMPVMDGITAAARMRAHGAARGWAPARIYAMTGLGSSDPRMRAGALDGTAELDGWLVKGKDDLKAIIRIVAQLRETQHGASPAVVHG
jgi:CheY-like chemotaxis protein